MRSSTPLVMVHTFLIAMCQTMLSAEYCINGMNRVLYQWDEDGEHKVIAHLNRSFKGAESNYFNFQKEILAIIYCL